MASNLFYLKIGIGILLLAFSLNAQTIRIEAETMTVVSGPAVFPSDTSLIYWSWGTAIFYSSLSGDVKITVRAKEDYAGDQHALFIVRCVGLLDTLEINTTDFSDYIIYDDVSASDYELSFINDFPNERNVHLDYVEIELLQPIPDTGKVMLEWDANTEPDLAGYRLWWGLKSRDYDAVIDVGDTTQFKLYWLPMDIRIYFAATAYDTASNESDYSNEVDALIESEVFEFRKGDWNKDRKINLTDLIQFCKPDVYGATKNDPGYNPVFDFNEDDKTNLTDLIQFCKPDVYGTIY